MRVLEGIDSDAGERCSGVKDLEDDRVGVPGRWILRAQNGRGGHSNEPQMMETDDGEAFTGMIDKQTEKGGKQTWKGTREGSGSGGTREAEG